VVCLAPRALGNCAPSAPWAGASVRALNFTVRGHWGTQEVSLGSVVASRPLAFHEFSTLYSARRS
jgi:hypothetical protein